MLSYKTILRAWDDFFFRERPTEGIALFRIIWFSLMLASFAFDVHNISEFFGPHAITSFATVRERFGAPHLSVFQIFGVDYSVLYIFMSLFGVSLLTSLIGFKTRPSIIVATICLISLHQRNIWLLSSSEVLMRIVMIYLACSPCGQTLSIDSLLAKRRGEPLRKNWAPWALRLIQIQLSVVYVWTCWHKLKGDDWIDGTAVYYATRIESMTNFSLPVVLDYLPFIRIATWGTLLLEFSLGTLIWIKELRKPIIYAGIIFHLGIEYMMSIPFFELIMVALLVNYFTPEELRNFTITVRSALRRRLRSSALLIELKNRIRSLGVQKPLSEKAS